MRGRIKAEVKKINPGVRRQSSSLFFSLRLCFNVFFSLPSRLVLCPSFLLSLSRRRSWPSGQEILTQSRVWKPTLSTPSPSPPSRPKASERLPTNWCRGRHKPVRLHSTGFTHTHTHWDAINVDWIMSLCVSLVHMFYSNVLSPTHAACSALSSAPDLAKPGTHLHIYLIYQPICPAPPPIHPSTFDCAFLPPLGRSLSYAAKASWQMEMEHRLMSRSSFSSPSFHFFPLYQCLMSLKGRNCLPLTG